MAYTGPQRDSAAVCSVPNIERLEQMLDEAGFALLVLTAESERTDGVVLARQNVVHEAGLFQGRLGWRKAIVLREDGCEEFSNIAGLGQTPSPTGTSARLSKRSVASSNVKACWTRSRASRHGHEPCTTAHARRGGSDACHGRSDALFANMTD